MEIKEEPKNEQVKTSNIVSITSLFGPEHESVHEARPDDFWQESYWVYFGNGKGLGGVVHIGQVPNSGKAKIFAVGFAEDKAFRRLQVYNLDSEIRASGCFIAGPYLVTPTGTGVQVSVKDEQFELELEFTDQSESLKRLPMFPIADMASLPSSTNLQAPGRVRGVMRLGDDTYDVDASAQRGHSWGIRNYTQLRGHGSRWSTGSFGDRLSYSAYLAIHNDGTITRTGFVVDRGELAYTDDLDYRVEVDSDGITYLGGTLRMKFPDREYIFRAELNNINLFQKPGMDISVGGGNLRIDGIAEIGYSAWEITDRPQLPDGTVPFSMGSFTSDGLHIG